jgi:hypothetical protein
MVLKLVLFVTLLQPLLVVIKTPYVKLVLQLMLVVLNVVQSALKEDMQLLSLTLVSLVIVVQVIPISLLLSQHLDA